ncbi:unnamed protein product, partial [Brachionus calyciflorus]
KKTYQMCVQMGDEYCKLVKYEELVQNKERVLREIVDFLGLNWLDKLLNHEKFIGDKIVLSDKEWSNDQINKAIYKDSLNNWEGKIPGYNEDVIKQNIKLLEFFGY